LSETGILQPIEFDLIGGNTCEAGNSTRIAHVITPLPRHKLPCIFNATSLLAVEPMIFRLHDKEYRRATAVEIVRDLEREMRDYPHTGGALRQFLVWSLAQLESQIPARELDLARRVSDETLAFSYLCLLDRYDIGQLTLEANRSSSNEHALP
jgi:hypothetical protein